MAASTTHDDPEVRIAELEGQVEQARYYFNVTAVWLFVSFVLAATFATVLFVGYGTFSQAAQGWSLGFALVSLIGAAVVLKRQRNRLFSLNRELRTWRVVRRSAAQVTLAAPGADQYQVIRERYRTETWEYVDESRRRASHNRRIHNSFQAIIILGSILVTSLTSAIASASPLNWITVGISISVTASAGLSSYFKFRERGFNLQQTANAVEKEGNSFELRIRDYAEDLDDDEAMRLFAERVEELKEEQRNRELQLEQSPERATPSSAGQAATPGVPGSAG